MEKTGRIAEMSLLANDPVVVIPSARVCSMSILYLLSDLSKSRLSAIVIAERTLRQEHSTRFPDLVCARSTIE